MNPVKLILVCVIGTLVFFASSPPPTPPPGPISAYLNGVFPPSSPGFEGSWTLDDPMPELFFPSPLRILTLPGEDNLLVLCKIGEVYRINVEQQTKELILDIKDRTFKKGEGGSVGIALHPKFGNQNFPDKQVAFIFYRTKPNPDEWSELGFNRLSKFTYNPSLRKFDASSEEILIQQFDRSTWHNGGGMFFGHDGFLYITLGDEGQDHHQEASTQRLDGGFFNGLIRIDVDNDNTKSHPIRRQPLANENAPEGWGTTFSQGYSIPNDNPWLSSDSSHLEEFFAIGLRSPYSTYYDTVTNQIWVADVGSNVLEEINIVEKEDNLQWPFNEGGVPSDVHEKPEHLIGNEKAHYFTYERKFGSCVIGGGIYRGEVFSELNEKYIFADYTQNNIMTLTQSGLNEEPEFEFLLTNFGGSIEGLPESPGITGVHLLENGEIFITTTGENFPDPSKILSLNRKTQYNDPPSKLSELNVFTDLKSLTPIEGIIPYSVNSPLWSDGAKKRRWIALPNDGVFDEKDEKIVFNEKESWTFPVGTVFIKHFELQHDLSDLEKTTPLETRFLIIGENGEGYGLTYKWDENGEDATLLGGGASREVDIYEDNVLQFSQKWDFPSRNQCITCHNYNAGSVLGFNTHQLNKTFLYPHLGQEENQLKFLNEIHSFSTNIGDANKYNRSYSLEEKEVKLESRLRSYLDANCASCHRPGGVANLDMDFRYSESFSLKSTINFPVQSIESTPNGIITKPGDHSSSEIWKRDASNEENKMPPIGRNIVDDKYIDSLAYWIDNIDDPIENFHDVLIFPNPTDGWLGIKLSQTWESPIELLVQSVSGKFIFQETINNSTHYLDLNNYPSGTYLLKIKTDKKKKVKKFVLY